MKVNIALIAALLALAGTAPGQVPDTVWTRRYDNQWHDTDMASDCTLDKQGNLYVCGWSYNYPAGMGEMLLIKYNTITGDTIWVRKYNNGFGQLAEGCCVDDSGYIYLTGKYMDPTYSGDITTLKIDPISGNSIWRKQYNHGGDDYSYGCTTDKLGNVYVVGNLKNPVIGDDIFIIKYSTQTGDTVWTRLFDNPHDNSAQGSSCAVDSNGNLYVVGGIADATQWYLYTIKYNTLGDTIWTRIDGVAQGMSCAVNNKNEVFTLSTWDVIKHIDDGTYKWASNIGNGKDVTVDQYGDVYIAGSAGSNYNTIKLRADSGYAIWSVEYNSPYNDWDVGQGCAVDDSGYIYVAGTSRVPGAPNNDDVVVVKYRQPKECDSTLVARYLFNGNARDTSGYGNHGTEHNGVVLTADRFGQADNAYKFDGVDDYILINDSHSLDLTSAITISAWIRPDTCPQPEDGSAIIRKGAHDTTNYYIFFNGGNNGLTFSIILETNYYGVTSEWWLTPEKVGKWFNIVSVYNGLTGIAELYSNGIRIADITGMPPSAQVNDKPLSIGSAKSYTGLYDCNFQGAIDDIRIYNRALSDAEILAIYNAEKPYNLQPPQLIYPPDNHFAITAINFLWHGVDSAASYRFQAADNDTFHLPLDTSVTDTSLNAGMAAEGQYYWRVKAYTAGMADSSNWSEVRTFHWDATAPPPPVLKGPPDMAWANAGPNLSWSASAGADLYGVQVTDDSTFALVITDTLTTDTFRYVPPLAEGKYFWRVAAGDSNGNWSGFSQVRRFRLDTTHVKLLWHVPTGLSVQLWDTIRVRFSEPVEIGRAHV